MSSQPPDKSATNLVIYPHIIHGGPQKRIGLLFNETLGYMTMRRKILENLTENCQKDGNTRQVVLEKTVDQSVESSESETIHVTNQGNE